MVASMFPSEIPLVGASVSLSLYEGEIDRGAQPEHQNLSELICTDDLTVQLTVSDQC